MRRERESKGGIEEGLSFFKISFSLICLRSLFGIQMRR